MERERERVVVVREKRKRVEKEKRWRAMLCWRIREEEGERLLKILMVCLPFVTQIQQNSTQVFNVFKHLQVY